PRRARASPAGAARWRPSSPGGVRAATPRARGGPCRSGGARRRSAPERVGHLLPRPLEEPLLLLDVLAGGLPPSLRLGALGALRLEVVAEGKVLQVARAEL